MDANEKPKVWLSATERRAEVSRLIMDALENIFHNPNSLHELRYFKALGHHSVCVDGRCVCGLQQATNLIELIEGA